jgi:hypothetical protein
MTENVENELELIEIDHPLKPQKVLTKNLYNKYDVLASLAFAILDKDIEQSIFWVCELFESGWGEEVADYLWTMYEQMFDQNILLGKFLKKMVPRFAEGPHIVATMARNLADPSRKYSIAKFMNPDPDMDIQYKPFDRTESKIFVQYKCRKDVEKYYPNDESRRKNWTQNLKYASRKDLREFFGYNEGNEENETESWQLHRDHWLYFASFAPIWKSRIDEHGGLQNHETMDIEFAYATKEDEFYHKYCYDLDEQSIEIQEKVVAFQNKKNEAQFTVEIFIEKYGAGTKYSYDLEKRVKIIRKKRIN